MVSKCSHRLLCSVHVKIWSLWTIFITIHRFSKGEYSWWENYSSALFKVSYLRFASCHHILAYYFKTYGLSVGSFIFNLCCSLHLTTYCNEAVLSLNSFIWNLPPFPSTTRATLSLILVNHVKVDHSPALWLLLISPTVKGPTVKKSTGIITHQTYNALFRTKLHWLYAQ